MSETKIAIGSFSNWLLFRIISFLMLILGLAIVIVNLRPFELQFFCMGTLLSLIALAGSHDLIYGTADENGIHYRQYFASRFVKWEEIAVISWVHAGLVYFHLKSRRRSHKIFAAQSLVNRSWVDLYSQEPDVVRWLTLVKPTAADGIEIRNPGASARWLLGRDPAVAARTLQFIFALIVVILIFSMIYARR